MQMNRSYCGDAEKLTKNPGKLDCFRGRLCFKRFTNQTEGSRRFCFFGHIVQEISLHICEKYG